jgi:S-adenosylmethionine:tRNA ribosyltransferase-isomerase
MRAKGLVWLGTRTRNFDDTVRFFRDTLGLRAVLEVPDFTVLLLPNGDKVEVFGPGDKGHTSMQAPLPVSWSTMWPRHGRIWSRPGSSSSVPFMRLTTGAPGPISEDPTATSTRSPRQRNQEREKQRWKDITMNHTIETTLQTTEAFPDFPEAHVPLHFDLPSELEAGEPPEARGLRRDEVRLMVSHLGDDSIVHSSFANLPEFLQAGDTLVINTSGTMNAALPATYADGTPLTVHLSTHLPADLWVVELRSASGNEPVLDGEIGEILTLPEGASIVLQTPSLAEQRNRRGGTNRLWISTLDLPVSLGEYLDRHGSPIRYRYVRESWPSDYYQSVYATEVGSAEMPSAGRAFTPELITRLVANGVQILPLVLHTGVASLEDDEPPYEEFYRVPPETAAAINTARQAGRRVVAVGTTVVRAL